MQKTNSKVALITVIALIISSSVACSKTENVGNSTTRSYASPTPRSLAPTPEVITNSTSSGVSSLIKLERCSSELRSLILDWNRIAQEFLNAYLIWEADYSSDADDVFFFDTVDIPGRLNVVIAKLTRGKNSSDCDEAREIFERIIAQREVKVNGTIDIRSGIRAQDWVLAQQGFDALQRAATAEIRIICYEWIPLLEEYSYAFDDKSRATYTALKSSC